MEKRWLARVYDESDPSALKAEIDTYWIAAGGGRSGGMGQTLRRFK